MLGFGAIADGSIAGNSPSGGGSTAYTLSGSSGSYLVTGRAATFQVARAFSGTSGAHSLTGRAATLQANHSLSGAAGSYSITGRNGTLQVGRSLAGANGAYSITGRDGTLTYTPGSGSIAYSLLGDAGVYTYTGQNAVLTYVDNGRQVFVQVGGGGEISWKDHLKSVQEKRNLERLLAKKKKEEEKLEVKIEKIEAKAEKPEGVLNTLVSNYIKVQEVRSEIREIEFQLIAVDKFLEAMDDDEDEDLLLLS